ncbi:LuxR C-terminal-related transcriptional regulator [Nonomuraea sp. 3-1Str]|uniref:ATP-binding protein n=1 Tax=Nonomuraea sp. 3-1Str TaxID=2929801 RepID=UPI00285C8856|nr:LuxR C-terminal-related transcriptional regulator [Nonomuraea sp. 3-1Str]MDR8413976.1 LuxR C-terminal-related transcriptional regulator [Nonomuraea sp. 3-1Str]
MTEPDMATGATTRRATGNLPVELTSFVGRRQELTEARRLLCAGRLLTLTGVGGVGKTRLALRLAAETARSFPDGSWLADLAPLAAGELLGETVAQAIGCPRNDLEGLREHLRGRRTLLVLDNCEHLLPECAALVGELLAAGPGVRILATSRQPLHVAGESVLEVPPLTVPGAPGAVPAAPGAAPEALETAPDGLPGPALAPVAGPASGAAPEPASGTRSGAASGAASGGPGVVAAGAGTDGEAGPGAGLGPAPEVLSEAVSLFADRVTAVVPDFTVDAGNSVAVTRLCRRLDGIPLAIELAAVRMRVLSVEQILDRLNDRFRLLTQGSRVAIPRQRTLRALVDWSYDLCTPRERALWRELSVFSGGWDLEAAQRVCAPDEIAGAAVSDVLTELVDKSIVLRREQDPALAGLPPGEHGYGARYDMLETLRQYGEERLAESGRRTALRLRHRDWCRELAERAEAEWFGEHQMRWLARLRLEQANVRAALEFCLSEPGQAWAALEIGAAMWSHRLSWTSPSEGHHWLERALAAETAPGSARAKALWVDAWLVLLRGDAAAARPLLEECRALSERLGDEADLAGAVHITGFAALLAGAFPRAFTLLEEALERRRALGHRGHAWVTLLQLAMAAVFMNAPRSSALCEEVLETARRERAEWSVSYGLWIVALDRWRLGDAPAAAAMMRDAIRVKVRCHDHLGLAQCLEGLAWILAGEGARPRAAELLGAAHMVWRSIGTSLSGLGHLAGLHDRCEQLLRRGLGDEGFTAGFLRGSELTLDAAAAYALEDGLLLDAGDAEQEPGVAAVLTRREREIAELVARGLSNRQIAETLVIAQRTAENHVENVLRKLGFTSRAQIVRAWNTRQAG